MMPSNAVRELKPCPFCGGEADVVREVVRLRQALATALGLLKSGLDTVGLILSPGRDNDSRDEEEAVNETVAGWCFDARALLAAYKEVQGE